MVTGMMWDTMHFGGGRFAGRYRAVTTPLLAAAVSYVAFKLQAFHPGAIGA